MSDDERTQSRRDFLRRAGTVAWATPLILTMGAPSAQAQTSCSPAGTFCGTWSTELATCLPFGTLCCGSCERAAPPQEQFCLCADV